MKRGLEEDYNAKRKNYRRNRGYVTSFKIESVLQF